MSRLTILILLLITLASCNKTRNVHFHGHIINGCSGIPAANISIDIYRDYDTGIEHREQVGGATTNSDGYYEFIADVPTKGFKYYVIFTTGTNINTGVNISHTENATSDSKDVLIDGIVYSREPLNFHIKNTNPFDNNDSFNYLGYYLNDNNRWMPIIDSNFHSDPYFHNLTGKYVDFIYDYDLLTTHPDYYFKYSYTKDGTTVYKYDTVHISCLGTTGVDIFY